MGIWIFQSLTIRDAVSELNLFSIIDIFLAFYYE